MPLPNDAIPVTQSWSNSIISPLGIINFTEDKQKEFYDGNYGGSHIVVTSQSLFNNPFLKDPSPTTLDIPEEPWSGILDSKFQNSDFDSLINNVLPNRESSFNQDADYYKNTYYPDNLEFILDDIAPKTQTPDSNYTSYKVILPRYLGSKLNSANYNFYTPPGFIRPAIGNVPEGVLPYFLNGDTGSWGGDVSYGKTAVIDSYPRYFAHFKYAKENKEFWDTATYKIDALIECPQEDLKGTVTEPKVLKIEDDNQRLYEVANNFVKGRKAKIDFKSDQYRGIDYQTLETAPQQIMQGGSKFILLGGNELSKTLYIESCSFENPTWAVMHTSSISNLINQINPAQLGISFLQLDKRENVDLIPKSYGVDYYLEAKLNAFTLSGGEIGISSATTYNDIKQTITFGPGLGLIHTYNVSLNKGIITDPSINPSNFKIGIPQSLPTYSSLNNVKDPDNYFTFKVTSSVTDLSSYEYYKIPFLIKRGDQIRVTWDDTSFPVPVRTSKDFVVLDMTTGNSNKYRKIQFTSDYLEWSPPLPYEEIVPTHLLADRVNEIESSLTPYNGETPPDPEYTFVNNQVVVICEDTIDPFDCDLGGYFPPSGPGYGQALIQISITFQKYSLQYDPQSNTSIQGNTIYDTINVWPNPLDFPIPGNKIKSFTIRRRVDSDNSVVIFQIPPKNSNGFNTLSGQGFIIPNDFSQTQKDNVLTLINALESKNAFPPDN